MSTQHRRHLALDLAADERVIALIRLKARKSAHIADAKRRGDLPSRPVGHADIAHQPFANEIVECAQRLLDRRRGSQPCI